MKLLVIRHAIAEDREDFEMSGRPDEERPLTAGGRRRMERAARGLRTLVPRVSLLASSPLVRALQTAAVLSRAFGVDVSEKTNALTPDAPLSQFVEWVAQYKDVETLVVVGHEPHLSALVTWLLSGLEDSRIALKKGGACLLDLEGQPRGGGATLLWLMTPRALRQLAD